MSNQSETSVFAKGWLAGVLSVLVLFVFLLGWQFLLYVANIVLRVIYRILGA